MKANNPMQFGKKIIIIQQRKNEEEEKNSIFKYQVLAENMLK